MDAVIGESHICKEFREPAHPLKKVSCNQLATTAKVLKLEHYVEVFFLWLFYFYQSADVGEKLRRVLNKVKPLFVLERSFTTAILAVFLLSW